MISDYIEIDVNDPKCARIVWFVTREYQTRGGDVTSFAIVANYCIDLSDTIGHTSLRQLTLTLTHNLTKPSNPNSKS